MIIITNPFPDYESVLFALKVLVSTYFPDEDQRIFGWFPIPSKYACWAELVIIQMLSPNVSFVGHLSGILVGLLYTMGPLRILVDMICGVFNTVGGGNAGEYNRYHQPTAPPEEEYEDESSWRGEAFGGRGQTLGGGGGARYHDYTGGLSEEEQLRRATEESIRNARQRRPYGWQYD